MIFNKSKITVSLFVSVIVLLPFSRLAELPILLLSIAGIIGLFKNWSLLKNSPQFKVLSIVFWVYFMMIVLSSFDSYWQTKTLQVAASSLRFYLAGIALLLYIKPKDHVLLFKFIALLTLFWSVDALFQYFVGFDVIGRASYVGRLNGIFGEHHVKLGPVLALLLPIVMIGLKQHESILRWASTFLIVITVLLSGTRSAWIMMAFSLFAYWLHHVKQRRFLLLLKATLAGVIMLVSLWVISPDFQKRIERSMTLFNGSEAGLDFALADRLPIWKASWNMIKSHPINGVGAHAFRKAYPKYAQNDDTWQQRGEVGMHAHHWFLEILTDTGFTGLLLFSFALFRLLIFLKKHYNTDYSWAFFVALVSAFLPITSSYSLFASFWSICLWFIGAGLILMSQDREEVF